MRNRIWAEITQAKHDAEFASLYAGMQRRNLRFFNIGVLVFSSGGAMGWPVWNLLPLVTCVIIAVVSLFRHIQPHLIMSERQIGNLDKIAAFYQDYLNKLEKLWFDSESQTITPAAVKEKFYKLKAGEAAIYSTINDTVRSQPKSIIRKATLNSALYFTHTFNTTYNAKRNTEQSNTLQYT